MLTEKEKAGISELLMKLTTKDLASLAQTVTSRLIVPETTGEAVHAILLHTDRPYDLLRRRKMKKEFLFKYLHAKRIAVDPSADKTAFVSAVLQLWGSSASTSVVSTEEDSLPEAPAPSRNTSYSSLCSLDFGSQVCYGLGGGLNSLPVNLDIHSSETTSSCGSPKTRRRRFTAATSLTPPPIRISGSFDNLDTMEDEENAIEVSPPQGLDHANLMADSFVKWFYSLINSTLYNAEAASEFGPQHFWVDASAKLNLHEGGNLSDSKVTVITNNAEGVAVALKDIVQKYHVTFNPNLTRDGVSGVIDPHGLAIVTACGTLHNTAMARCCGTFHQQFGLIRDPGLGNNWKIKFTVANLTSSETVSETPILSNLSTFESTSMVLS